MSSHAEGAVSGPQPAAAPGEPPARRDGAEPSLARSTLVMTLGTGLSRVTGLLRTVVLVVTLGVAESDLASTYGLANNTPNILYELVLGGILSSVFVPAFVQANREEGKAAAFHLARLTLTVVGVVLGCLSLLLMVGAEWVMHLYTLGVADPVARELQQEVGAVLLLMFMPQIVLYGMGAVMTGLLNANRRFGVPMFAPVLNNLAVIATGISFYLLASGQAKTLATLTLTDKLLLGLGTTAGVVLQTMIQWPVLRRIGFRYRPVWDLRHPRLRSLARLSRYAIGYVAVYQLANLAVPVLANRVRGGYAAYQYANQLFQFPYGLFAVSVMTALLPSLTEHQLAGDWRAFRATFSRGLRLTALVLVPATLGYLALGGPLIRLLFDHGVVQGASVELLTRQVTVLVLGLVTFSLFQLTLRAFYALQDTRTPFRVMLVTATVWVGLNVALSLTLPGDWKVAGLAAAYGLAYVVGAVLLLQRLRARTGGLDGPRVANAFARITAASLVMAAIAAAAAAGTGALLPDGTTRDLLMVTAGVAAGLVTYLGVARLLRIEELTSLTAMLGRRLKRG